MEVPDSNYYSCFGETVTLRDQFAMAALQGMLAGPKGDYSFTDYPEWAYEVADAMLKAREQSDEEDDTNG